MNILQVCAYAAPYEGNFMKSLKKLDEELSKRGHNTIYAFCNYAKEKSWCIELKKTKKVFFLPQRRARINPRTYFLLRKIIIDEKIDIVHSHFELYDLPLGIVTPKTCKQFWHLHDTIATGYQNLPFYSKLLNILHYRIFSKKAVLLSVSKKHMDFVCDLGFEKDRAIYIPNGADISRLRVKSDTIAKYDFMIFAWDYMRKGGDLAIAAAKQLSLEGYDFRIGFVGNDLLWKNPNIQQVMMESWFVKQEFVESVSDLYNSTRCFLHISRAEGCSYALLEATYFTLPIISSDIDENIFLNDVPTIQFVSTGSVNELYFQMKRLLDNNFLLDKSDRDLARTIIVKNYSLEAWVQTIMDLYSRFVKI